MCHPVSWRRITEVGGSFGIILLPRMWQQCRLVRSGSVVSRVRCLLENVGVRVQLKEYECSCRREQGTPQLAYAYSQLTGRTWPLTVVAKHDQTKGAPKEEAAVTVANCVRGTKRRRQDDGGSCQHKHTRHHLHAFMQKFLSISQEEAPSAEARPENK
eukprot:scaffold7679_cov403-Prasinococcus_capsulatus_cf.AAC.4